MLDVFNAPSGSGGLFYRGGQFNPRRRGITLPSWLVATGLPQPLFAWDPNAGFFLAYGRSYSDPAKWISGGNGSFVRPSKKNVKSKTDTLFETPENVPAIDFTMGTGRFLFEGLRTNYIRNNQFAGAVAGSPGTLPNNWGFFDSVGLSREISFVALPDGRQAMAVRWFGTISSGNQSIILYPDTTTAIVAAQGETWVQSLEMRLLAGSFTNIGKAELAIAERTSAGAAITATGTADLRSELAAGLKRYSQPLALASATTGRAHPRFGMTGITGAVDVTILFAPSWQMEKAEDALSGYATSIIKTSGAQLDRAADQPIVFPYARSGPVSMVGRGMSFGDFTDNPCIIGMDDGTSNNRAQIRQQNSSPNNPLGIVVTATASQAAGSGSAPSLKTLQTTGMVLATDDMKMIGDAAVRYTDTSVILPTTSRLTIGGAPSPSSNWRGYVGRGAVFGSRISDQQMIDLQTRMAA